RDFHVTGIQTCALPIFRAKSGQMRETTVTDARLARLVRRMEDLPGQHLFQYLNGDGEAHPVGSHDVNNYLCETMGDHFTAKNFQIGRASCRERGERNAE